MAVEIKLLVLILASAGIIWVSRPALRHRQSHGFYRFVAWECLVLLALMNLNYWFYEPLSLSQIVSWLCLVVSLFLVLHGLYLLRVVGRPDETRAGADLLALEKTTSLVTVGAYRYIRHPLYSSLLFLAWGIFFKWPSWPGLILTGIATLFLTLTARVEEFENIRYFGPAYRDYMLQTWMFIPYLF